MPPCKPERAYTKNSVSTSGSMTQLLKLDAEAAVAEAVEDEPADRIDWKPERKQWLAMISLSLVSFVVSLDATILVTALPEISHSLRGSAAETFWTGTAYLLISAVFQPVIAAASACCGRQRLLVMSIILFTFGTAFCAVAHDFAAMLTGRCVQGVGGGGVIAMTQVIFCDMVPLRQRPQYLSMVLASWSIGSIIGPVIGGAFVESASWRWCFYINFLFCFLGFFAALLFVDDVDLPLADHPRRMDWLGAFLFVGSTTSLLLGISSASVGICSDPRAHLCWHAWYRRLRRMAVACTAAQLAAYLAAAQHQLGCSFLLRSCQRPHRLYYVPFYQMSVRGSSPVRAGIDLFPAVCLLVPGSVVVAILTSRLGRFQWAI
ncbi:major facilitator superfamily transporter [Pyrenophora tritici-repentis]|nr:major facilitator superfamily transporter [Pyrenophora tritici-repentis]